MKDIEAIARSAIKCGLAIHRDFGPGLLESAYEALIAQSLRQLSLRVERQKPVSLVYNGVRLDCAFKADLLVEEKLLIELKALETVARVHAKQLLTHLRLLDLPLGLLMNFGGATFKEGVQRVINTRADLSRIEMWRHPKQSLMADLAANQEGEASEQTDP